jgi:hypothetical protein
MDLHTLQQYLQFHIFGNEQVISGSRNIMTYKVKETNATKGTHHQSISDAIAKGKMPQKRARVCL